MALPLMMMKRQVASYHDVQFVCSFVDLPARCQLASNMK
jgi:hypothetical protein